MAMHWYNEPPTWHEQDGTLTVTSGAKTDFWRTTHYGFIRDDGNFYYQNISGDFTATVKITGQYRVLYDQAGIMIRENEFTWLKCGIEFVEGVQQVSAVVTRKYSDWSVAPLPNNPASLWLRVHRRAEAVEVWYSLDGEAYTMLRLAYLTKANPVQVGLMCAAPQSDVGVTIVFEEFRVET
jgi:regulation of enolase protein 1 (concanavalin A-like superfamily)